AQLELCNRTSYVLYAANAFVLSGNSISTGWTRVRPGVCKIAIPANLGPTTYYVYARTSQAHAGEPRAWGGQTPICVKDTNFAGKNKFAGTACDSDDYFRLPFAAVNTKKMKSWTMTFSESPAIGSMPVAEQAGLERLLHDLGY